MFNGVHDATTAGGGGPTGGYGSATGASPSSHIPPNCLAIHIACLPNSRVRSSAPRVEFYLRLPDNHHQHDNKHNNNNNNHSNNDNTTPSPGLGPETAERRCVDLLRQQPGGLNFNFPGNENGWTRQALAQAQAQAQAQEQEQKQEQEQALAQTPGSRLGAEVAPSLGQDQEHDQGQGLAQEPEQGQGPAQGLTPAQTPGPNPEHFPTLVLGTRIGQLFDIVARASELTLAHMFAFQSHRHHR